MGWKITTVIEFVIIVGLILENWGQQSTLLTKEQQLQDLLRNWKPKPKREHGRFTR